jgi:hypothetical protein
MRLAMILKKSFIRILLITISLTVNMYAQDFTKAGSSAAQFLKIPVGAKAVSLGNSFASIADDATAMYWNPAGLPQIKKFSLSFTHTQWIADLNHNFFGLVLPLDEVSSVGFGVIQLSTGNIKNTTISQPEGTGLYFDAADLAISVSYARRVIEQVILGVSAKYINQRIWNTSAQTVALDFGILLNTGFYDMKMGFSFQNFGPGLTMRGSDLTTAIDQDPNSVVNPAVEANLATQPFPLPTSYRASISMPLVGEKSPFNFANSSFVIAADVIHPNDNPEHYSIGMEYGFMDIVFLRGGYIFNTDEEGLTLGAGVYFDFGSSQIAFDYSYSAFGVFNSVNVFSVNLSL